MHREVPSAQKYVQRAVKSGDSNDVLLLSCALGWLAEYPGARSVEGMEAESRIDDVVSNARKHFRPPLPPLPPRTKWTRRVPHPVLIGHAASLSQAPRARASRGGAQHPRGAVR